MVLQEKSMKMMKIKIGKNVFTFCYTRSCSDYPGGIYHKLSYIYY